MTILTGTWWAMGSAGISRIWETCVSVWRRTWRSDPKSCRSAPLTYNRVYCASIVMTWRWVTSFNLAMALCCAPGWCATVSGRVQLSGSKDHAGMVIWLESAAGKPPDTPPLTVSMSHRHKTFEPHVLALRVGSKVQFPNLDPFFHNAFSNYDGQLFDVGLHAPGTVREVTFHRRGVVRVFCNIHPTMSAVIVALDTPWFAISNAQGTFRIPQTPPGEYRLKIFYERAL